MKQPERQADGHQADRQRKQFAVGLNARGRRIWKARAKPQLVEQQAHQDRRGVEHQGEADAGDGIEVQPFFVASSMQGRGERKGASPKEGRSGGEPAAFATEDRLGRTVGRGVGQA